MRPVFIKLSPRFNSSSWVLSHSVSRRVLSVGGTFFFFLRSDEFYAHEHGRPSFLRAVFFTSPNRRTMSEQVLNLSPGRICLLLRRLLLQPPLPFFFFFFIFFRDKLPFFRSGLEPLLPVLALSEIG